MGFSTTKLTFDTDDGRMNYSPSTVVLPSGQQICFYAKFLTTGKESFSRITFVEPSLTVNVESGSGSINGIPVIWSAGTLTAPTNSYSIVYVTNTGVLGIGADLSMTFLKDVILLAYVSSGFSSITRIYELEHTGYYIYVRKQVLSGGVWVWDDLEFILNSGSEPLCFYNSVADEIYLSYKKDSASYVRSFIPSNELTWEYLTSISIATDNSITLKRNPENTTSTAMGSGYRATFQSRYELYPLGVSGFSFVNNDIHVFLPVIAGSYVPNIIGDITYEFFSKSGDTYTLEASYIQRNNSSLELSERHRVWLGTIGVKYVGIRIRTQLFQGEYVSSPTEYVSFEIYTYQGLATIPDPDGSSRTSDKSIGISMGSGYAGVLVRTAEYVETKYFESDRYPQAALGSGYVSIFVKTAEYDELKAFELDRLTKVGLGSGYATYFKVTNI